MISSCMDTLSAWKFSYSSRLDFLSDERKTKIIEFFWWKICESTTVLWCLFVDNFDLTRKLRKFFWMKNSWKYNGFVQFVCWQLWFDEKNYGIFFNEKISIIVQICTFWLLITLICQENLWKNFFEWKIRETTTVLCCLDVDNFDLTRKIIEFFFNEKIVKILQFCTFWLLTTLIWQENCGIFL